MTRKTVKFLLSILLVVTMSFSFFTYFVEATEAVTTSETDATASSETTDTSSSDAATTEEPEIYNGDLYLFDTKVVMDKLVDGNVFIMGQEVEITGQINGSLFVCANTLSFNQCYVKNTIFACANSVTYNGACNDLYVVSSENLEMTYDSYVVRDVKALTTNMILKAAIGRDADLCFTNINLGEGEDIPIVYGNLRYTAPSEITIPEGVMTETGTVTYTNTADSKSNSSNSAYDILMDCLIGIATVLALYFIIRNFTPNFAEKLNTQKLSVSKVFKAFGKGLGLIIGVTILFVLLLITQVGVKLAFVLLLLFVTLCLIAVPLLAIIVTNILKPLLKINKTITFCLVLSVVKVILYLITLIPFVGWLFTLILTPTALGMLINIILPSKELTDEEKIAIEESKKIAKENKEKKKQEKLEKKEAKKQAKLEAKESKKEDK